MNRQREIDGWMERCDNVNYDVECLSSSGERMVRMLVDKSEEQQGLLDKYIERDEALPELEAEMGRACKEAELAHLEVEVCHFL